MKTALLSLISLLFFSSVTVADTLEIYPVLAGGSYYRFEIKHVETGDTLQTYDTSSQYSDVANLLNISTMWEPLVDGNSLFPAVELEWGEGPTLLSVIKDEGACSFGGAGCEMADKWVSLVNQQSNILFTNEDGDAVWTANISTVIACDPGYSLVDGACVEDTLPVIVCQENETIVNETCVPITSSLELYSVPEGSYFRYRLKHVETGKYLQTSGNSSTYNNPENVPAISGSSWESVLENGNIQMPPIQLEWTPGPVLTTATIDGQFCMFGGCDNVDNANWWAALLGGGENDIAFADPNEDGVWTAMVVHEIVVGGCPEGQVLTDGQCTDIISAPAPGDLNCDNTVSVVDVQLAIVLALELPLNELLDADADGKIDNCAPVIVQVICGANTVLNEAGDGCELKPGVLEAQFAAGVASVDTSCPTCENCSSGSSYCGPGTSWNGVYCAATTSNCPGGNTYCGSGTSWNGSTCIPNQSYSYDPAVGIYHYELGSWFYTFDKCMSFCACTYVNGSFDCDQVCGFN